MNPKAKTDWRTWIEGIWADELNEDAFSEEFTNSIENRSLNILEIKDTLFQKNHRAFNFSIPPAVAFAVAAVVAQLHQSAGEKRLQQLLKHLYTRTNPHFLPKWIDQNNKKEEKKCTEMIAPNYSYMFFKNKRKEKGWERIKSIKEMVYENICSYLELDWSQCLYLCNLTVNSTPNSAFV